MRRKPNDIIAKHTLKYGSMPNFKVIIQTLMLRVHFVQLTRGFIQCDTSC